jgi:alpha-L-rhamnosidase
LDTEIPANTTATIWLPASTADNITESGKSLAGAPSVQFVKMAAGEAVLAVGSGTYHFVSR